MLSAIRLPLRAAALGTLVASGGCMDIVSADFQKYVEREQKTFTTGARPEVTLATFDGSIEIRPWDKPEVQVIVEKRGSSKEATADIEIVAGQDGDKVSVEVKAARHSGFNLHFNRSAKLIVSMPAASSVVARSGDGSIDIERITGRVQLRSGDGSIRGNDLGEVTAHTGDGSIRLADVRGTLDASSGDGSIVVSGRLTAVRVHTGDGSVAVTALAGSSPSSDWDITTGDGSVRVEVPEGFNADLDAHSGDGHVTLGDLTLSNVTGRIDRNSARGRLGSGGPRLRVRTGDGSITLRRAMSAERESR